MSASIQPYWTSFYPGFRLLDGGEVGNLQTQTASSKYGISAGPAGNQAAATPLGNFINEVGTAVAGGGVKLSPAVTGLSQVVVNSSTAAVTVWGNDNNPQTPVGVLDQIMPVGAVAPVTNFSLAVGGQALLVATRPGFWKRMI